jgi:predicted small metal-binding protein
MKTMSCKQLGGACEQKFHANTFEEIAELSKQHGMEMHQKQDAEHLYAMQKMQELMKNPEEMNKWFESKRKEFESLPES